MRWLQRIPLTVRFTLMAALHSLLAAALAMLLYRFVLHHVAPSVLLAVLLDLPLLAYHVRRMLAPAHSLFRALAGTVASYRDGDFSFGLKWDGGGELRELVDSHNALGDVLREQRTALVQRELLLDTMVQNTPVAMLLVGDGGHVVYANLAARHGAAAPRATAPRACGPR